ncbi:MAG: hypothetical protein ABFR90_11970 [Planctomycetota bacterium]
MKKWIFAVLLLAVSNIVFADGKVFKGRDLGSFFPITEETQHAIIAHKDGREAMLLAVNFSLEDNEKAFWLFPVLGKPEEIKADIVDIFPWIRGDDPRMIAKGKFQILFGAQIISQPYTWPYVFCVMPALSTVGMEGMDLNVRSVVEKHGLRIETLSAKTTNSLSAYLKEKDIRTAESELEAFSDYLNEQYSLIFVEIYSKKELLKEFPEYEGFHRGNKERWPSVFVEFPSEKIFFPLKPTSSYKDYIVISLKILGYVKNEKELNESWRLGYYKQRNTKERFPDVFKPYISEKPLNYTSYLFRDDAPKLNDDLWMVPFKPKGVRYARLVNSMGEFGGGYVIITLGVLLFLLQSWVCAGVTGLIFFRKWHPYAVLGLGNVITLLGVYFLAKYGRGFLKTELQGTENKLESFRLYKYGKKETKKTWFLILFSFFFMISSIVLYVLFTLPFYGT